MHFYAVVELNTAVELCSLSFDDSQLKCLHPGSPVPWFVLVTDAVAGHDVRDSTTVTDQFQPVRLDDDFSLKGVHVGIPKVLQSCHFHLFCFGRRSIFESNVEQNAEQIRKGASFF